MNLMLPLTRKKYFLLSFPNITQQNKIFSLQTMDGRERTCIYFHKNSFKRKVSFTLFSYINGNIISESRVGGGKS